MTASSITTEEIEELIQALSIELDEGSKESIKKLLEDMIETQTNTRVNEEAEKYEECLKKLESDIRKHIQVITIVK